MVKISLSGVNKRFIISSVWWENGYVRRGGGGGVLNYEMPGIEKALGILNNPW